MLVNFNAYNLVSKKVNLGTKHTNHKGESLNVSTNPIAYRDFNINFGARLFRSPENFYEQDFNRENMPKTLREYIYNPKEYGFRRTIPPKQAMEVVFADLKDIDTLEDVKILYPNEPLFNNLKSSFDIKARTGILGDIRLLREPGKPLFKNGKDDLGVYILKKIYLEGKSLKEIDEDLHKDISVVYKGLDSLKHTDLYAFGIKFPNNSFWHSFLANRKDFDKFSVSRKLIEESQQRETGKKPLPRIDEHIFSTAKELPKRRKMSDEQKSAISEGILNYWKNLTPEEREKRNSKLKESVYFKFRSPIGIIAANAIGLSDKMIDYYIAHDIDDDVVENMFNFEGTSNDQNAKRSAAMKDFWRIEYPGLNMEYGKAIKDTLNDFEMFYDLDGNNPGFQRLLELAQDINDEIVLKAKERRQNRADAKAAFMSIPVEEENREGCEDTPIETIRKISKLDDIPMNVKKVIITGEDGKEIEVEIGKGGQVIDDLEAAFKKAVFDGIETASSGYRKCYYNFLMNHPLVNKEFKVALVAGGRQVFGAEKISDDELIEKGSEISRQFFENNDNKKLGHANDQAMIEAVYASLGVVPDLADDNIEDIKNSICKSQIYKSTINARYAVYDNPVIDLDIRKAAKYLTSYMINFSSPNNIISFSEDVKLQYYLMTLISKNINDHVECKNIFERILAETDFLKDYGGAIKVFGEKKVDNFVKDKSAERVMFAFMSESPVAAVHLATIDMNTLADVLLPQERQIYEDLLRLRSKHLTRLPNILRETRDDMRWASLSN